MKQFANFKFMFLLVTLMCAGTVYGQDNIIDEVVWVVGDDAILKSDVEEYRLQAQYSGRRFDGDPYCIIPEEIAIQKLFLHQAKLDSVEVSESEVIQRVEYQMNAYIEEVGSREKLEEYFSKTSTQIREAMRENIREGETARKMQQKLVGEVKVTPSEVRRYFKDLPEDSIPYIPTQVEVQIITLQPKIPVEEIDDVKRRLREYTERVNKGEIEFASLARLYSEDKGSALNGGELGFRGKGVLVPEFANVAFNLTDPTKISKIVETEFGFHIIQLIEKRGDRINVRHILLKPKVSSTEMNSAIGRLDSIADDIRNQKFTFEQATTLSHDKETRNNHGLMPNPYNNTARFEMQQLPQEIARKIENMKVGEISEAFQMVNQKDGKEVCAIVKLKARINGHKAVITEDYQRLKEIVVERKQQKLLDKWILDKLASTYVRINDKWKNCEFKHNGWIKD
jgi:Parvulin-like peptidyl-prolyl isomerase